MLDEILEERVASSRGRRVPRGVKRKMSGYQLRPRAPQPTVRVNEAIESSGLDSRWCLTVAEQGKSLVCMALLT